MLPEAMVTTLKSLKLFGMAQVLCPLSAALLTEVGRNSNDRTGRSLCGNAQKFWLLQVGCRNFAR